MQKKSLKNIFYERRNHHRKVKATDITVGKNDRIKRLSGGGLTESSKI